MWHLVRNMERDRAHQWLVRVVGDCHELWQRIGGWRWQPGGELTVADECARQAMLDDLREVTLDLAEAAGVLANCVPPTSGSPFNHARSEAVDVSTLTSFHRQLTAAHHGAAAARRRALGACDAPTARLLDRVLEIQRALMLWTDGALTRQRGCQPAIASATGGEEHVL